tara:strand:- start:1001 stop:1555 length:555 start_codon:yes stop_codon:yes gene_type:complete
MLSKLRKCLLNEKKNKKIFDIVVYGSIVKGKQQSSDIDIAVIFREGSLKDRLEEIQSIKKQIKNSRKIDIKGILWEELFKQEFFARSGIFLEGISIFDGKPFANKMDFTAFSIFVYSLKNKTHTEKVKFNYILAGRGKKGMIEHLEGKHLAPGVVQIPMRNALEFEEILNRNGINFEKKEILIK